MITTITSLNEEQIQNRLTKGLDIYNNGLVEPSKTQSNMYIVKAKYFIEDLTMNEDIEPSFICSCPDHQYRGVKCAHIIATEFYIVNQGVAQ